MVHTNITGDAQTSPQMCNAPTRPQSGYFSVIPGGFWHKALVALCRDPRGGGGRFGVLASRSHPPPHPHQTNCHSGKNELY